MKLTKLQRYTAYCILLEEAEEAYAIIRAGGIKKKNFVGFDIGGVCDIIENIFNFYMHRPLHFLSLTEFLNKKPHDAGLYWWNGLDGWEKRIEALKQCIIETHP